MKPNLCASEALQDFTPPHLCLGTLLNITLLKQNHLLVVNHHYTAHMNACIYGALFQQQVFNYVLAPISQGMKVSEACFLSFFYWSYCKVKVSTKQGKPTASTLALCRLHAERFASITFKFHKITF